MTGFDRSSRVKRQILREASVILKEEIKDPRVGFVTLTDVSLSPDFRHAKIFVSIMGSPPEQEETLKALGRAAGFVRAKVGERIRLRYTPEIAFVKDESVQYADRIFRILGDIKKGGTSCS